MNSPDQSPDKKRWYCVLRPGCKNAVRMTPSIELAAEGLKPGTVYGVGRNREEARAAAERQAARYQRGVPA